MVNSYLVNITPLKKKEYRIDAAVFTSREVDILACMISGRSFKSIASLLCLSPKTVETHTRNIFQKMDIHSKEDVINKIESSGLYAVLKEHYFALLMASDYEKCLLDIKPLIQKDKNSITIIGPNLLINPLKEDFMKLGLSTKTHKTFSKEDHFKKPFIIVEKDPSSKMHIKVTWNETPCASPSNVTLYSVCFLEILGKIFPDKNILNIVSSFIGKYKNGDFLKKPREMSPVIRKEKNRKIIFSLIFLGMSFLVGSVVFNYFTKKEIISNVVFLQKSRILSRENAINSIKNIFNAQASHKENPIAAIVGIGGSVNKFR